MLTLFKRERSPARPATGGRRTRVATNIAITLSGKDAEGHSFKEDSYTTVVSRLGAKIPVSHNVVVGTELTVENLVSGRTTKGHVVWCGERRSAKEPNEIGIYLADSEDFWGIELPEEAGARPPVIKQDEPPKSNGGGNGQRHEESAADDSDELIGATASPSLRALALGYDPGANSVPPLQEEPTSPAQMPVADEAHPSAVAVTPVEQPIEPQFTRLDESKTQLTLRLDQEIDERSKQFQVRLLALTTELTSRCQGNLESMAEGLEDRIGRNLEDKIAALEVRLREPLARAEALLPMFQNLPRWQAELEKAQASARELSAQAVQFAFEELNDRIQRELEPAAANIGVQAREQVQQESRRALDTFLADECPTKIRRTFTEVESALTPIIESKVREVCDLRRRAAVRDLEAELAKLGQNSLAQARTRADQAVHETFDHINRQASEVELQFKQHWTDTGASLRASSDKVKAEAGAGVAALEKKAGELSIQLVDRLHQEWEQFADASRQRLLKSIELLEQKSAEAMESRVYSTVGALAQSSSDQLRKVAEARVSQFVEQMEQTQKRIVEETAAAFRAKIAEILVLVQTAGTSGRSS